jgi:hypothetical protein
MFAWYSFFPVSSVPSCARNDTAEAERSFVSFFLALCALSVTTIFVYLCSSGIRTFTNKPIHRYFFCFYFVIKKIPHTNP